MTKLDEHKTRAKLLVAELRKNTFCEKCGAQPIDWHCELHLQNGNWRVAHRTARGESNKAILAEIARCTPLCRSCHMREDGRIDRLRESCPYRKGVSAAPAKSCFVCSKLYKPLRKGLCNACNHQYRLGKLNVKKAA